MQTSLPMFIHLIGYEIVNTVLSSNYKYQYVAGATHRVKVCTYGHPRPATRTLTATERTLYDPGINPCNEIH